MTHFGAASSTDTPLRPTDPIPRTSPMAMLLIERANALIRLEANRVRKECPNWTEHEIEREAKRRNSNAMVHAANQIEACRRNVMHLAANGGTKKFAPASFRDRAGAMQKGNFPMNGTSDADPAQARHSDHIISGIFGARKRRAGGRS
jgi:hypothetical protein